MPAVGLEDENLDPFAASADGAEDGGELVDDQKVLKRARELFQTIPSLHKGKGVLQPANLTSGPTTRASSTPTRCSQRRLVKLRRSVRRVSFAVPG